MKEMEDERAGKQPTAQRNRRDQQRSGGSGWANRGARRGEPIMKIEWVQIGDPNRLHSHLTADRGQMANSQLHRTKQSEHSRKYTKLVTKARISSQPASCLHRSAVRIGWTPCRWSRCICSVRSSGIWPGTGRCRSPPVWPPPNRRSSNGLAVRFYLAIGLAGCWISWSAGRSGAPEDFWRSTCERVEM